ncbi:hypothetical protein CLU79DRAFT_766892 [Phycomyces nitens]|nr:hypothetical protein CLU79DRAFT_766892 [Phycomyces nitens]
MFKSAILFKSATHVPKSAFFHVSETIASLDQARAVFKKLGQYGEMIEYKFQRCPETKAYMQYGYVTYKNEEDAQKALVDKFVKVDSPLFKKVCEVTVDPKTPRAPKQQ